MRTCRTCGLRFIGKRCPECKTTMTDTPKPPEGYKTWLGWILSKLGDCYGSDTGIWNTDIGRARAELAQLRAKAAAYDEAMSALRLLRPECFCAIECRVGCDLCAFVGRELAANRFTP